MLEGEIEKIECSPEGKPVKLKIRTKEGIVSVDMTGFPFKINKEIEDLEHKVDNKVTLLLDRDEKIILDALKIRDQVFIGIGVLSCVVVVIGWALNFLKH